jgi:hypothetical protein
MRANTCRLHKRESEGLAAVPAEATIVVPSNDAADALDATPIPEDKEEGRVTGFA